MLAEANALTTEQCDLEGEACVKSEGNASQLALSSELLMLIGFVWCLLGFMFKQFWWELGGFMLLYMGVMTLVPVRNEEEDTHEEGGES